MSEWGVLWVFLNWSNFFVCKRRDTPENARWQFIIEKTENIGEAIDEALAAVEEQYGLFQLRRAVAGEVGQADQAPVGVH
ncbi:MAG: hypothetical protein ACQES9_14130, partial [Myxococcota bacterium]